MSNPIVNLNNLQKIIAIILGVIITAVGIFFGMRAIFSRASGDEPQSVSITDATQNSAKVSWTSAIESQCTIEYGTSPSSLNSFAPEVKESVNHAVDLTLLSPSTPYHFKIKCAANEFDNGGVPWTFTTKAEQEQAVIPTATPTATLIPTQEEATESASVCPDTTDCAAIKAKLNKECSTIDYLKCLRKPTTAP